MREMQLIPNTLTYDRVLLSAAQHNLLGFKIIVSPHLEPVPVLQMHPDCDPQGLWCTPQLRAETNQWLVEMFGKEDRIYMYGKNVVMNPKQAAMLRSFV